MTRDTPVHRIKADIKGIAKVTAFTCHREGLQDIQAEAQNVFLICVKQGRLLLQVPQIPHPVELSASEATFLAFPKNDWKATMSWDAGAEFYMAVMDAGALHRIINPEFDPFQLDHAPKINMRDLMKMLPVSPALIMCFDQLMHHKLQPPFSAIFQKAKFLEIFSLLMDNAFGRQPAQCPVMLSPAIESKIHKVRRHISENIAETPDPDHLAVLYDLPRQTLREGYRYLYGKTIHQYHADHKLESAMQMLASGELLVKEVAFRIGYQNPSHFIAAFKKRYGVTPREYMGRENVRT